MHHKTTIVPNKASTVQHLISSLSTARTISGPPGPRQLVLRCQLARTLSESCHSPNPHPRNVLPYSHSYPTNNQRSETQGRVSPSPRRLCSLSPQATGALVLVYQSHVLRKSSGGHARSCWLTRRRNDGLQALRHDRCEQIKQRSCAALFLFRRT